MITANRFRSSLQMFATLMLILVLTGCYHATVRTGPAPLTNAPRIERQWAHGFLWGLVPPGEMDVTTLCPQGAALVETQVSFANQLAAFVTSGIYTPMTLSVTCRTTP